MTSRNWVFTLNNPSDNQLPASWPVKYAIWQLETGENGTPHLQGYLMFDKTQRLTALKKIDPTAHWEVRRGNHEQAAAYASKEDTRTEGPWTVGKPPSPGQRTDLTLAATMIKSSGTKRCAEEYPETFIKYSRGLQVYRTLVVAARNWPTKVLYYWGDTGTGKSRTALEEASAEGARYYFKPKGDWFDNYDGEEHVILDDYYGDMGYHFLLNLLDRYPMQVPFKGGFHQFVARTIWITSNKSPWELFDKTKCPYAPLERRLTENDSKIKHFGPYTGFAV